MRGWMKLLLALALTAVAGACGQAERLASPDAARSTADGVPWPGGGGQAPQDDNTPPPPAADSTGRWGGGLGSGT